MSIMLWDIDNGLHYADSTELYAEATKLMHKANNAWQRNQRDRHQQLVNKALSYVHEANRIKAEEDDENG